MVAISNIKHFNDNDRDNLLMLFYLQSFLDNSDAFYWSAAKYTDQVVYRITDDVTAGDPLSHDTAAFLADFATTYGDYRFANAKLETHRDPSDNTKYVGKTFEICFGA